MTTNKPTFPDPVALIAERHVQTLSDLLLHLRAADKGVRVLGVRAGDAADAIEYVLPTLKNSIKLYIEFIQATRQ